MATWCALFWVFVNSHATRATHVREGLRNPKRPNWYLERFFVFFLKLRVSLLMSDMMGMRQFWKCPKKGWIGIFRSKVISPSSWTPEERCEVWDFYHSWNGHHPTIHTRLWRPKACWSLIFSDSDTRWYLLPHGFCWPTSSLQDWKRWSRKQL